LVVQQDESDLTTGLTFVAPIRKEKLTVATGTLRDRFNILVWDIGSLKL
jgi:hypothetical protein